MKDENVMLNYQSQKMSRYVCIYICLARNFTLLLGIGWKDTPTLGYQDNPRILLRDTKIGDTFGHQIYHHRVFFNHGGSDEMYVGGADVLLKIDVDDYHVIEKFPLKTTGQQQCKEGTIKNIITVIEKLQNNLLVCGTNGCRPQCWSLSPPVNNQSDRITKVGGGVGISPFVHTHNYISLTVEGDLYSVAPLHIDGSSVQFRRKAGNRTNVWMHDSWVTEPTFISASWVKRKEDPDNDKIYIFFREKNSDQNPEVDPWISRVSRVCKVDEGGSKRFFQNMWTSFLKARLICGFPEESLYFNRLQDIYVMHAEDWRDTRVYALFTSSWNSTAVCIYSVGMIEDIFEKSPFKGYDNDIPTPRPGTCVKESRNLPLATVNMVKDYPEMKEWVHSMDYKAPFYISSNNYTKIAVDQVQAADQHMHNILLLSTDNGKIHKVLEAGSQPFIISETQLFSPSTVQSMKLDSKKKKLVVVFSEKISTVDLQRCQDYNDSCENCILARDPYCGWTELGCTPTVPGAIQNVTDGDISVCNKSAQGQNHRNKRDTVPPSPADVKTVHSVPLGSPIYLSCPIESYHAVYTWEHGLHHSPCLQMQSNCLHLIPVMTQESYGHYKCISKEKNYTKEVKNYHLAKQIIPDTTTGRGKDIHKNDASAVVPQIWIILGMVAQLTI